MLCPGCLKLLSEAVRFCPQCGHAFAEDATVQNAWQSPTERHDLVPAEAASGAVSGYLDQAAIDSLLIQANLCRIRQQWPEAVDYCISILRAQPGNQAAHSLLGDIYRDQGKVDDAIQWYRMAVDLRPNPSDQAKLARLERERALMARNAPHEGNLRVAIAPDGSHVAGTTRLMGVSPRRWLSMLTLTSLTFLCLIVLALVVVQVRNRSRNTLPRPIPDARKAGFGGFSSSVLAQPGAAPPRESAVGSGFGGDTRPASPQLPRTSATPPQTKSAPMTALPPAPVLKVKPYVGVPPFNPNASEETRNALSNLPVDGNAAPQNAPAALNLPGGMQIIAQQYDPTTGTVQALVTASQNALNRSDMHEFFLKTVYRAARAAFENEPAAVRAQVGIQTHSVLLLSAEMDRRMAYQVNPDAANLAQLEGGLIAVQWTGMQMKSSGSGQ
jgi:hypothetical protein